MKRVAFYALLGLLLSPALLPTTAAVIDEKKIPFFPKLTPIEKAYSNCPVVSAVRFRGNLVIEENELSQFFLEQIGFPQDSNKLVGAINSVEDFYHSRGLLLARVIGVKESNSGILIFDINEGIIGKITVDVHDEKARQSLYEQVSRHKVFHKPKLEFELLRWQQLNPEFEAPVLSVGVGADGTVQLSLNANRKPSFEFKNALSPNSIFSKVQQSGERAKDQRSVQFGGSEAK